MADNPSIRRYQTRVRAGETPGDAFADFLATIGNPAGRSRTIFSPQPVTADCDPVVLAETGQCVSSTKLDVQRFHDLQTTLPNTRKSFREAILDGPVIGYDLPEIYQPLIQRQFETQKLTGTGGDGPGKGRAIAAAPPTIAPGPPVAIPTDGLLPTPVPNLTAGVSQATNLTPPVPEIIAPVESVANGGSDASSVNPAVRAIMTPALTAPTVAPRAVAPRAVAPRAVAPRTKTVVRPASVTRSTPGWSSTSIPCIPKEVLADYMKAFKKRKRCP